MAFLPLSAIGGMLGAAGSRQGPALNSQQFSQQYPWAQWNPIGFAESGADYRNRMMNMPEEGRYLTNPYEGTDYAAQWESKLAPQGRQWLRPSQPQQSPSDAAGDVQQQIQGTQTLTPMGIQDMQTPSSMGMQGMQTSAPMGQISGNPWAPWNQAVNPWGGGLGAVVGAGRMPLSLLARGGWPGMALTFQPRPENRVNPPMAQPYGFGFRSY
jgi:hypothetical protein